MKDPLRHFTAEFVGIFALVFIGSGSIIAAQAAQTNAALVVAALAHGLILAVFVSATMRVSGHLNPAITLAMLVTRRIEPMMAGLYIIAQLLGAMAAAYALKALLPVSLTAATRVGGQSVSLEISATQAIGLEAIATFFLAFAVFGTAVDSKSPKLGGLAIGAVITADILAIGPFTGASMNPARSFGPAVASGIFEAQAVYWVGPIVGAIAAALIYEHLFIRRDREPVDHGAVRT
jgi:MIP family channel proteins